MNDHHIRNMARIRSLTASMAFAALAACSTSQIDTVKTRTTGIASDESVVIMARSYHLGNDTETDFTKCIGSELGGGKGGFNVVSEKAFVDAMFPWFEPRTAPGDVAALPKLMSKPAIADRMKSTGVRYVVWLDGNSERTAGGGSVSCAAGAGGAGCFGFAWWQTDSNYDAVVWDLESLSEAGSIEARVSGTSYLPAIVIPVPMIARTQATAFKDLAGQIRQFIGAAPKTSSS